MPIPTPAAVCRVVLRAILLSLALLLAWPALADDDAVEAVRQFNPAEPGWLDESGFGFRLQVPDGWSIDIDAEDGPQLSWRMHRDAWLAGRVPKGLLALNVTVIEPEPGQNVEAEFRRFVVAYADRYLGGGRIVSFRARPFGTYPGFVAAVEGRIRSDSGESVKVSARVILCETQDRQVIVSAVAPQSSADPLDHLGEPGSLIVASGSGSVAADTDPAGEPKPGPGEQPAAPVTLLPDAAQRLRAVSWGGGSLEEFGRVDGDGLLVALPAGARTAGVGVASRGSPVTLGDLDGGDATTMRIALASAETDSLIVVLCPGEMVPCMSEPSLQIRASTSVAGADLSLWTDAGLLAKEELPGGMPEHLTVRIDRDAVYLFPAAGEPLMAERPRGLVSFAALDVVIAALPTEAGGRVRVRSLSVDTDLQTVSAPLPVPDATASVFPATAAGLWRETASSGGDFAAFATLGDDGLAVSVPAGHSWGVTGIVSDRPMLGLPDGDDSPAPERLHGTVDPTGSDGFAIAILPDAQGDVWLSSIGYADVSRMQDGSFRVRIYACGSSTRVAQTFIDGSWSGRFDLILRPDRLEIALDDRHLAATWLSCLMPEAGAHVAVVAVAAQENEATTLRLAGLSIDRLPLPAAMPVAGSGRDTDFRPEAWIASIAEELSEPDQ